MIHELKILPEYFQAIKDRVKTFEIRENIRGFMVGEILTLKEYENGNYTGREVHVQITYITNYAQKDNYVVMAINVVAYS